MNLRKLAGLLAGMGEYLSPMVKALLPRPAPDPEPYVRYRDPRRPFPRFPGLSGNAHQRRIAIRSSLSLASRRAKGTHLAGAFSPVVASELARARTLANLSGSGNFS